MHAAAPEAEEAIKWGAPAFTHAGQILLVMASFKAHAALNFWRGPELVGKAASEEAMGQFGKLKSLDDLPSDAELDKLIAAAAKLAETSKAPRKPKAPPKKAELHPEFAAALENAPKAKENYDNFAPGQKREYCDWINTAKRDATREKRIAQAVEWIGEGKTKNWKYQDC